MTVYTHIVNVPLTSEQAYKLFSLCSEFNVKPSHFMRLLLDSVDRDMINSALNSDDNLSD